LQTCYDQLVETTSNNAPLLAFPNGKPYKDFTKMHCELSRKIGFKAAFSCAPGVVGAQSYMYSLPRFTAWDKNKIMFHLRMLRNSATLAR